MFTGLIERTGMIDSLDTSDAGAHLTIRASGWESPIEPGESIAIDGVCLTVASIDGDLLGFDLLNETLERTRLSAAETGTVVNLERAMRYGDRFGGHMVSGHIDTCGTLTAITPEGRDFILTISLEPEHMGVRCPEGLHCLEWYQPHRGWRHRDHI